MRKRALTIVVLATVLGLLVASTATAGTIRTSFTGTSTFVGDGWAQRYWEPGRNIAFWRDAPFWHLLATDDPRANGIMCTNHNGNYRPSPGDPWYGVQGQMWGTTRLETDGDMECTNSSDYWEGTFVGDRFPNGNEYLRFNLKGYGNYAGLHLRMEEWSDPDNFDDPFFVAGEILDPGGH